MPKPDQVFPADNPKLAACLETARHWPAPHLDPVREVSELRQEVRQLRADLLPPTGAVLTGRAVVAEFERLTKPRS